MCKFKKLGLFALAKTLNEEEIAGLKQMFAAMDADKSGTITVVELQARENPEDPTFITSYIPLTLNHL